MIRIALVSPLTLPFYCGNSILAERLQQGLTGRGYEVSLFNSTKDDPGDTIKFSPHLIHSLNADKPYQWMKQLRSQYRVPWVITLTGTDYNDWIGIKEIPSHIKESMGKADAVVVFHKEAFRLLKTYQPQLIQNKISIIPQAVAPVEKDYQSLSIRKEYGIDPHHVIFLMVSGMRPLKNIPFVIETFYEVEKQISNVVLLHAGPVIDRKEAKHIRYLGKQRQYFQHLGELSTLKVRKLMQASDVFLNASFHEGMSCAILEAMSEGLPVLASSAAGNLELVKDCINGLLFSVDNREALAGAAMKLAHDPGLRNNMGEEGKKIIARHHSEKRELDLYESLYRRLL